MDDGSVVPTSGLFVGGAMKPLKATGARGKEVEVPFAVAQGFVYGDGTCGSGHRPAFVTLHGEKDKALLGYFSGHDPVQVRMNGNLCWQVRQLPRHWKRRPPLDESRSFLFSWLAGYFAADGTVDKRGSASISSADRGSLEFVRSVAAVCGVGYGIITTNMRSGFGRPPTALYTMALTANDLPEWFWIIDAHRERVVQHRHGRQFERDVRTWFVVGVRDLHQVEEVYCAVVPGVAAFALADDLMTGNCPVKHGYVATQQRHQIGMYRI